WRDIKINTASGDVDVERTTGDLTVNTASGDVRAGHVGGRLTVNSASGDVSASRVDGAVEVKGASADVEVDDLRGDLRSHTASGDVSIGVTSGTGVWLDLNTFSGRTSSDLTLSGDAPPADHQLTIQVRTMSGDIDVHRVPARDDA